jgi:hypothetical protein
MKTIAFIILTLVIAAQAHAQLKPLSQSEYVKLLYALQKDPAGKADIVDALRKRGIDFAVTDGIRSLTRSKGANDEELKSALEEAGRRQKDPEGTKLPSASEANELLERSRQVTRDAIDQMPDFVVKQIISRSAAYAGTGNWKQLDTVVVAVSYSSEKGEQYQVLAMNGAPVQTQKGNTYSNIEGSTTGGEFVEALEKLFRAESKTTFSLLTTDTIRSQPAIVYDFEIKLENNKNGGVGFKTSDGGKGFSFTSVPAGEKGRVWIDRKTGNVLKLEYSATDIPRDFRVQAYTSSIDYDWVNIAGERVLLPITSDNRFTSVAGAQRFQDRNYIRFREYQKFGSEVRILDDDVKPEPVPSPVPDKP